ncbi:MAG: peptide ABC transporter substrate-binding protein [Microcoleus sp. SIO2G3]|nr:peptide ABC transporter substrate-binding protein [Microcoleus sp. SIO2G3]
MATLTNPDREAVQILVIGSDAGITNVIHSLHIHGFAEVREWSLLLPAPIPKKRMRTLTRYVSIE